MILAEHKHMVEQFASQSADEALGEGVMFGARTAVRTTSVPTALNRDAKRAPSLVSRSTTSTSGWLSSVAFRACCAHQSSDGARVTAAWPSPRLFWAITRRMKTVRQRAAEVS